MTELVKSSSTASVSDGPSTAMIAGVGTDCGVTAARLVPVDIGRPGRFVTTYLSLIENGKRPLASLKTIRRLADALAVPPAQLVPWLDGGNDSTGESLSLVRVQSDFQGDTRSTVTASQRPLDYPS